MRPIWNTVIDEGIKPGLISSAAVAAVAGIRGGMELGTPMRPINGISHIVWGPQAGNAQTVSVKYTVVGLTLNAIACWFWAALYRWGSRTAGTSSPEAVAGAAGIAALAYITDYHVVPRRFTPGFELCLSRRSFPWLYAALAAGLFLGSQSK